MNIDQRCAILETAGPFALLGRPELEELALRMTECFLRTGDTVFEQGAAGDAFFVVVSGRARVVARDAANREVSLAVLKRGEHFGEVALLLDVPRSSTVRAADDLVLLRLDRAEFLQALARHPELRVALERYLKEFAVRDFLKRFTALGVVPGPLLRQIVEQLEGRTVTAGTILFRDGDSGDRFYIVREGTLDAFKAENGTDRLLNSIGPGEFFGELALLNDGQRTATLVARTRAELYSLSREAFLKIVEASPEFRHRLGQAAESYTHSNGRPEPSPTNIIQFPPEEDSAEDNASTRLSSPSLYWRRLFRLYPFIAQHDETDCGAACLAMITGYHGVPVGVARLRDLANTDQEGASLWSVAQAAETIGFRTRGLRLSYDALKQINAPSIAHWEAFTTSLCTMRPRIMSLSAT